MKKSHSFLIVFLLAVALSGCSSCPCKKSAESTAVVVPQAVATPAAVQVSAPAVPAQSAEEVIPAAVRK